MMLWVLSKATSMVWLAYFSMSCYYQLSVLIQVQIFAPFRETMQCNERGLKIILSKVVPR
jgi:hypothetical protein